MTFGPSNPAPPPPPPPLLTMVQTVESCFPTRSTLQDHNIIDALKFREAETNGKTEGLVSTERLRGSQFSLSVVSDSL